MGGNTLGQTEALKIRIENIVATVDIGRSLNLAEISSKLPNAIYNSKRFPGIIMKINKPKATVLIFSTGRMVCAGTRSEKEAYLAVKRAVEVLRSVGVDVEGARASIQNIVASAYLSGVVDVEGAALNLGRTMYEPDQFPAVIFRMDEPRVTMLIFSTGKIVCAGAKNEREISRAVEKLKGMLEEKKLIRREPALKRILTL